MIRQFIILARAIFYYVICYKAWHVEMLTYAIRIPFVIIVATILFLKILLRVNQEDKVEDSQKKEKTKKEIAEDVKINEKHHVFIRTTDKITLLILLISTLFQGTSLKMPVTLEDWVVEAITCSIIIVFDRLFDVIIDIKTNRKIKTTEPIYKLLRWLPTVRPPSRIAKRRPLSIATLF